MLQLRRRQLLNRLSTGRLRVAIVAETFLPAVNGVTNSVLRAIEHLERGGHDVLVIAPGPGDDHYRETPVVRVRSFGLPGYDDVRIGVPSTRLSGVLREFGPDVVHVAAPSVLGAIALRTCARLEIPTVAIFQTDLAGFAKRVGLGRFTELIWAYLGRVHRLADRTLAPSRASAWSLTARGVPNVELWQRGVDLDMFNPRHRNEALRRELAPRGEVLVGFVGRLAREKQLERLAPVTELDGVRVVIVGDGPERERLERRLPNATFLGFASGARLSELHASFDLFVHTGIDETFCQALQESMASGVPSVAPSAGGPLDLVQQGTSGFFWSPEVPETLVGAVGELAADELLRRRLGHRARDAAEQRPWPLILDALVDHYREIARTLGEPARRAA